MEECIMSQTNDCGCNDPVVRVPVHGLELALDKAALGSIGGGGVPGECASLDLKLGVETKTNTSYMGKPVYTQLFDFGTLPNNTKKAVSHGIPDVDWIQANQTYSTVFFSPQANHPLVVGSPQHLTGCWYFYVDAQAVYIVTGRDRRVNSAIICLVYTKTTDSPVE